jgi:hypothetical protein
MLAQITVKHLEQPFGPTLQFHSESSATPRGQFGEVKPYALGCNGGVTPLGRG